MPRGIVLSSYSPRVFEDHRILLNNKTPFQKMDENHFLKALAIKWTISQNLIQELIELKKQKSVRSKFGNPLLSIFCVFVNFLYLISGIAYS